MRIEIPPDRPRVEVTLNDGSIAVMSPLLPSDREYMIEGLSEMSLDSRYMRFGQGRYTLSGKEWTYLTEVDQTNHVAWAAAIDGEGAGVARFIRFGDDDCAEVAVTVLDRFQSNGLGTALLLTMVAIARHDRIPALCFEVVPSNTQVREVLHQLQADLREVDGLIEGRIEPGPHIEVPFEDEVLEVMRQVRDSPGFVPPLGDRPAPG